MARILLISLIKFHGKLIFGLKIVQGHLLFLLKTRPLSKTLELFWKRAAPDRR
jgi:hypothetical protein